MTRAHVDKLSRIPLYCQLMDILIEDIQQNMKEDDQIPSEREICEQYNVSRSTVRQAMQEMEKDGYIYRVHGKGTFVAPLKYNQDLLKFYSFTEAMKKLGKIPASRVLKFEVLSCDRKVARKLEAEEHSKVYKFVRLRLADDRPMMLETTYLPVGRFPGLTKEKLESMAMYDMFSQEFSTSISSAKEVFQAVSINEEEAWYLQIDKAVPGLKIERYTYEQDNIIEYTRSIARGDKFEYCITLNK
ncbi:GntR family transcriptional regulator [Propionispora vibrioides]|uniref:GntR family transcriptional regulator n=1 Tax=Propionispora vibrioides TaxID=112903 RepID=A0A1H8W947_9FIRM|nr:GntR family transcriptional regulator [Propionispora vibrioides]SEP23648.1 GntR family transcriptional regulator [Propionispora vibrioides]